MAFLGDDSSSEDPGEDKAEDEESKEAEKKNGVESECDAEEPAAGGMEVEEEDDDNGVKERDFSFPDTTISLSHLKPSR